MRPEQAVIEVGKPFPGPYPDQEGAVLELKPRGPVIFIQLPGCIRDERRAFKDGLRRYGYLEHMVGEVPLALFALEFKGLGAMGMSFDARLVQEKFPAILHAYLNHPEGVPNAWHLILLDDAMVQAQKLLGVNPKLTDRFISTIVKQLAAPYTREDFEKALRDFYLLYTDEDIFKYGAAFKQPPKRM